MIWVDGDGGIERSREKREEVGEQREVGEKHL